MATIRIYGIIGDGFAANRFVTAADVAEQLEGINNSERLLVRVNSPGGNPLEAISIVRNLADRGPYDVQIDGAAISAGSIIPAKAERVAMTHGARMMVHNVWKNTTGDADKHEMEAALLRSATEDVAQMYSERTGIKLDAVREMMRAETWMSAAEAKAAGFVDEVLDEPVAAYSLDHLHNYVHVPKELTEKRRTLRRRSAEFSTQLAALKVKSCQFKH